jgi:long-chain fatty acid transport protein
MKLRAGLFTAWLLWSALTLCGKARAGFIEIIGLDPRSSAMGGAATAVADTPSAWYYNPAGLAQIRGAWQEVGLSQVAFLNLTQRDPETGAASKDTTPATYNLHFPGCDTYGLKDITIGLGGGPNFGGLEYFSDKEGDMRYTAYETMTILNTIAPTIAYRVNRWLMIGCGLEIVALNKATTFAKLGDDYIGAGARDQVLSMLNVKPERRQEYEHKLIENGLTTRNGRDDGKIEFYTDKEFPTGLQPTNDMDIDMKHFSYNLGVLLFPAEKLRVGLTYREELRFYYEGPAALILEEDVKSNPLISSLASVAGTPLQDEYSRWKMDVVMPRQFVLGLAYQATDTLLLAADFQWTNWASAWDTQVVTLEGKGIQGMTSLPVNRKFDDTFSFRIGAEYNLGKGLRCQAGYWYDPTPVPDSTIDGTTMDADRHVFSCGLGYYGLFKGHLDITSVFQYILFEDRLIPKGASENLGGFKKYGTTRNDDFAMEFSGNIINLGIVFGIHY